MSMQYGASFSVKYARELEIDPRACLRTALQDLGVRRLRLMSYWDVHEPKQGVYDFAELDWQMELAKEFGAEVTLCLGLRQPRWPESHWPKWAKELPDSEWQKSLLDFITVVIERYRDHECIVSYQLENEALLRTFGLDGNFDRSRLKREFSLVKSLDTQRPVIMTTSDSWGFPFFGPKPDVYGYSLYRYFYNDGKYEVSGRPALVYRIRAWVIYLLKRRRSFIHELQAEPWGPTATVEMPLAEQFKSVDLNKVRDQIEYARSTGLYPIDVWGLEWWYCLTVEHDHHDIWNYMRTVYKQ